MKISKKILISALAIFIVLILPVIVLGIILTDHNINGFVGMAGVIRLAFGNDYAELTNEPIQVLVRENNLDSAFSQYFEHIEGNAHVQGFHGYKDGVRHHAVGRAFTRRYWIFTIQKRPG